MNKDQDTLATEVLKLLKEQHETSELKSRQAIKRIYIILLIVLGLFVVSIVDSIYQRCRIIKVIEHHECVEQVNHVETGIQ